MTRSEILSEATACVTKDRNSTHGEPEKNFDNIAGYWNQYLGSKLKENITAKDVAAMCILIKMSRLSTSPTHADNWIDIAGYAACGGEIATQDDSTPF